MSTPTGPQDPYGQQPNPYGEQPNPYGQQPPAYGQQPPAYGQQPGYPQAPGYSAYGQGGYVPQPQGTPPPNYLVWAIITILLCTIPGIVALVFSTQVNSKWSMGDTAGAYNASKQARTWSLVGTILGGIAIVVYIVLIAAGAFTATTYSTF